jgi:hypothetical protein
MTLFVLIFALVGAVLYLGLGCLLVAAINILADRYRASSWSSTDWVGPVEMCQNFNYDREWTNARVATLLFWPVIGVLLTIHYIFHVGMGVLARVTTNTEEWMKSLTETGGE